MQRQIIQRMSLSGFMLFLSVIMWIVSSDLALALPGLALMVYLGISGSLLLYRGIGGGYICVAGTVKQVEVIGWRKKAKWIFLDVDGRTVQCPASAKQKNLVMGDRLNLYLSPSTPIYEQDGGYRLFTCLAMEQIQEKH